MKQERLILLTNLYLSNIKKKRNISVLSMAFRVPEEDRCV